jgi:hypothetical protein
VQKAIGTGPNFDQFTLHATQYRLIWLSPLSRISSR